jgi:hypothetical protein
MFTKSANWAITVKTAAALLMVLAAGGATALAAPVGIDLTATVTAVDDFMGLLGGALKMGDTLTVKYVFDSATTDSSALTYYGAYSHQSAPYGLVVRGGGLVFQTNPANVRFLIGIGNNSSHDVYQICSYNNLPLSGGVVCGNILWQLDDFSGTATDSDALLATAPSLGAYNDGNNFLILGGTQEDPGLFGIQATVTSATLASDPYDPLLPEPATLSLLGLGLAGLVMRRKRK